MAGSNRGRHPPATTARSRERTVSEDAITLSVVVPVYNEAENVAMLADEIVRALADKNDYEIVFVDDGSDDATEANLVALKSKYHHFRALRHAANAGQSAALWTGIKAAKGAWIATLDGDGQNDPADIPKLLRAAEDPSAPDGLTMVAGVRARRQDSWLRRMSSRLANRIRAKALGDATPDTGCGLKLFRRNAFLALPAFNHMHRFLPALVQRGGGVVTHIEVHHRPRHAGQSKYGFGINSRLWVGIADLLGMIWLQKRRMNPAARELDG